MNDPWHKNRSFELQMKYESEGAAAGLAGKNRADCPYDEKTDSLAWNHWVFGCEVKAAPQMIYADGTAILCSTGFGPLSLPEDYLLKYPDGRITTPTGEPAELKK